VKITKTQIRRIISESRILPGERALDLYADMSLTADIKSNMLKLIEQVADNANLDGLNDDEALESAHDAFCSLVSEIADAVGYHHVTNQMDTFQRK